MEMSLELDKQTPGFPTDNVIWHDSKSKLRLIFSLHKQQVENIGAAILPQILSPIKSTKRPRRKSKSKLVVDDSSNDDDDDDLADVSDDDDDDDDDDHNGKKQRKRDIRSQKQKELDGIPKEGKQENANGKGKKRRNLALKMTSKKQKQTDEAQQERLNPIFVNNGPMENADLVLDCLVIDCIAPSNQETQQQSKRTKVGWKLNCLTPLTP